MLSGLAKEISFRILYFMVGVWIFQCPFHFNAVNTIVNFELDCCLHIWYYMKRGEASMHHEVNMYENDRTFTNSWMLSFNAFFYESQKKPVICGITKSFISRSVQNVSKHRKDRDRESLSTPIVSALSRFCWN